MNQIREYLKKLLTTFKDLSTNKKIIAISAVAFVLVIFFFSILYTSSATTYSYLFKSPLSLEEYGAVTSELSKMGIEFQSKDDKYILIKDEETGRRVRMKLIQEGKIPGGIKAWDIFDMESWTTTDFERNIKLQRALRGAMAKHITSLPWVESVNLSISFPKKDFFTEKDRQVKASVTLQPKVGYSEYLKNKKIIRGIEQIIAKGIDGLDRENIVITSPNGEQMNDFVGDDYENTIKKVYEENKIKNKEINNLKNKMIVALNGVLARDRYRVAVDIEINFNKKTTQTTKVLPVVLKNKTPGLSYDDSKIIESVKVSEKVLKEKWNGNGFIPEGPPGQEDNIPPGYKEHIEGKNEYFKDEKINNFKNGEENIHLVDDAMEVERKSVSVIVDGEWKKEKDEKGKYVIENGSIKRIYIPYSLEDISKLEKIIKGAINYNNKRGDTVVVSTVAFDRSQEFADYELAYFKEQRNRYWTFVILIGLLSFMVIFGFYLFIKGTIIQFYHNRRLEKEEQSIKEKRDRLSSKKAKAKEEEEAEIVKGGREWLSKFDKFVDKYPDEVLKIIRIWLKEN